MLAIARAINTLATAMRGQAASAEQELAQAEKEFKKMLRRRQLARTF